MRMGFAKTHDPHATESRLQCGRDRLANDIDAAIQVGIGNNECGRKHINVVLDAADEPPLAAFLIQP